MCPRSSLCLALVLLALAPALFGQSFVQVSMEAGYPMQTHYRLSDDRQTQLPNESWDLAFTAIDMRHAGVLVNESTSSLTGMPAPELKLFATDAEAFSQVLDTSNFTQRLYNADTSWAVGALNQVADPEDPFDFGWGRYDPVSHSLTGSRVFALQLRDGSYRKIMVDRYAEGAYTLRYARLDGSDEHEVRIGPEHFSPAGIARFSVASGEPLAPLGAWDLLFCRYYTEVDDGAGNVLDYPVTGVLSGPGVEVAQAMGVDPATVDFEAYTDSLTSRIDVIGYDWKYYDFTEGWIIPDDLAYFVKTPDGHLWRLAFVDFEGSSTGVSTLVKTDLGLLSAVIDPQSNVAEASLYPNPAVGPATLAFTLKERRADLTVEVRDLHGRLLRSQQLDGQAGLNVLVLDGMDYPSGVYLVHLRQGRDLVSLKMIRP